MLQILSCSPRWVRVEEDVGSRGRARRRGCAKQDTEGEGLFGRCPAADSCPPCGTAAAAQRRPLVAYLCIELPAVQPGEQERGTLRWEAWGCLSGFSQASGMCAKRADLE